MRVMLNGVSTLKARTGVGHTTANLHRALVAAHPADTFWLSPGAWAGGIAGRVLRGVPKAPAGWRADAGHDPSWRHRLATVVKEAAKGAYRTQLQTAARWGDFDLYHEPNFVPVRTALPTIVTVHDLSVLLFPNWHPAERVLFHERHFHRELAQAAHVLVVSESVRRECVEVLGLDPERVTAVHNGIDDRYVPQSPEVVRAFRQSRDLPSNYFLAVGTIEPRKNIATLMRAYCDLPAGLREHCPLVLAGGWGWKSQAERDFFESEARHRGVRHLGYMADVDLPALYGGATALLYPSFYEGFGLPPVEMLACGGAVIASTAAAVREVLGPHAAFLDPLDLTGWRDAMRRVLTDRAFAAELRSGGIEHAHGFTWQRAAGRTHDVYRRVLHAARTNPIENQKRRDNAKLPG